MAVPLRTSSTLLGSVLVEHEPAPELATVAVCTWHGVAGRRRTLRMLPDGCADLLWDGTTLSLAGPAAAPAEHPVLSPATTGLRLAPGAAGPLFGLPVHELPVAGIELAAVWGARARVWERRLADADAPRAVLEELVAGRLGDGHVPDPVVVGAVRGLDGPGRSVDDVARDVGLSPRALRRRFRDDVGYGPKALHRVLRFRRTLAAMGALAGGRLTLAAAAARFGYADQAHLCREARALAGSGPTELIQTWAAHGDRSGRNVQDSAAGPGRSCDT